MKSMGPTDAGTEQCPSIKRGDCRLCQYWWGEWGSGGPFKHWLKKCYQDCNQPKINSFCSIFFGYYSIFNNIPLISRYPLILSVANKYYSHLRGSWGGELHYWQNCQVGAVSSADLLHGTASHQPPCQLAKWIALVSCFLGLLSTPNKPTWGSNSIFSDNPKVTLTYLLKRSMYRIK